MVIIAAADSSTRTVAQGPTCARARMRGQAMPMVLVFLMVLCVGLLVTFNTGQVVGKKVELTNAADAAAYSIAVEQARARNFAAYLNRGRVANEVAIAQVVSLNSWLTMVHSSSVHFEKVVEVAEVLLFWVPALGQVLIGVDRAMTAINSALKVFRRTFLQAATTTIGLLDQTFDHPYALAAEAAVGDLTSEANVFAMASKVVKDNVPDADLTVVGKGVLAKNVLSAGNQLESYNPGERRGLTSTNQGGERYRNVVMASRDTFTRARDGTAFGIFNNNGGTDMVEYDRWSAVDTFQLKLPLLFTTLKIPIGWAGTQAVNNRKPNFFPGMNNGRGWRSPYENNRTYRAYNGTKRSDIAGAFIEGDPAVIPDFKRNDAFINSYRYGISPRYRDVKDAYSQQPDGANAGPIYTVEVGTRVDKARTSSALKIGSGRMQLKDQARGDQLRAMASAQVYFNRPSELSAFRRSVWGRGDSKFEKGSLFSPYWQARLVQTPISDRTLLVAAP
ncbi:MULTISPECIES: pilus assembly protein TadG-related protein [Xanthomonas]|uniref:pilus assembly protein TadG-related protein n=1 Tax=Xanthomonas TaxID=338 RepID=UPI001F58889E|nr:MULTISPECIES: pilus assembly protein TadG-related protein [Xanthomonas]MCI2244384.1 pilus assembly protein TadG-related protein [Xanthomonas indica]UYC12511.1 pilus assembly protein TadG-related protein [Xanthomonas sp. CFBP 8445]